MPSGLSGEAALNLLAWRVMLADIANPLRVGFTPKVLAERQCN
jgi:hypothetical protein